MPESGREASPWQWRWTAVQALERIRLRLAGSLQHSDELGILRKLLLNAETPGLPSELLRHLGFVHLLTETGIHLYALMGASTWALGLFFSLFFESPPTGARWFARVVSLALGFWCWALAGFRPGFLRPALVIGVRSVFRHVGARPRFQILPLAIGVALDGSVGFAMHWLDPTAPDWAPGRLHYSLAVAGGLWGLEYAKKSSMFRQHAAMAVGSWLATAVWDLFAEHWIAAATPIYSLVTIPVFAQMILPVALLGQACQLLGLPSGASLLLDFAGHSATWVAELLTWIQTFLPGFQFSVEPWVAWGALIAALGCWLLSSHSKRIWISAGVILLMARFGLPRVANRPPPGADPATARSIEMLDVGQGEAILVKGADGRVGLVDSGSGHALSDGAWLDLLLDRSITRIDWALISHLDEDHAGGLIRLSRLVPIGCIRLSRELLGSPAGRRWLDRLTTVPGWSDIQASEEIGSTCVPFPVWVEPPAPSGKRGARRNHGISAIFIPLAKHQGFFFSAGDAGGRDELQATRWAADTSRELDLSETPVRIHKLNHHGSRYSSSDETLHTLRPTESWVSAGVGNTYGHPSIFTLERVHRVVAPSASHRTDREGSLLWTSR